MFEYWSPNQNSGHENLEGGKLISGCMYMEAITKHNKERGKRSSYYGQSDQPHPLTTTNTTLVVTRCHAESLGFGHFLPNEQ